MNLMKSKKKQYKQQKDMYVSLLVLEVEKQKL